MPPQAEGPGIMAIVDWLVRLGLTPIEVLFAIGILYLFREQVNAKRDLATCYAKMSETLAKLPADIMNMAVSFTEHRSDGINVTGDAVISGRDTTKSDVSYEPIVPRAARDLLDEMKRHREPPDNP